MFFDLSVVEPSQHKYINDKYRVLIITRAGAEGVDTINTQNIIIMDSQWNDALSEQIIARAIRYKSHYGLPQSQRYVNVYRTILMRSNNKEAFTKISSPNFKDWQGFHKEISDTTKLRIKLEKQTNEGYLPTIKELKTLMAGSSPFIPEITQYKKVRGGITQKSKTMQSGPDGWETYKALDNIKDADERESRRKQWRIKAYSQWYISYGQTDKLSERSILNESRLTSDLNMLLLAKSKQKNIEEFCEMFGNNITMFEKYQSKLLPKIIEAEQKLKRQLNDDEQAEIYAKLLKDHNMDILKTEYKPKLDNSRDLDAKLQEYFTNNTLAEYVLTKSSIKSNNSKINVLEPTAGDGALVRPILKLGKDATIDMVEIDPANRFKLKELVNMSPASLSLKEQGNFLKYLPSQRYDYIFMNPPFHLRKSENALLKKDVFDYDFVKRAFALLKVGGELIAITSKKWTFTKDDDIKEWFENSDSIESFDSVLKEGEKFGKVKIDITILKIVKKSENEDNDILQHNFYNNKLEELGKDILNNEASVDSHKNKLQNEQYKESPIIQNDDEQVGKVSKPKRKTRPQA